MYLYLYSSYGCYSTDDSRQYGRFTRENTVFVVPAMQRRGIGRVLLSALIDTGRALGLHALVAFIDEENVGSIELHRALGFAVVGGERETGYKFGGWRSSVEMELLLSSSARE